MLQQPRVIVHRTMLWISINLKLHILLIMFIVYQYNVLQGYFGTFRGYFDSTRGISVYQRYFGNSMYRFFSSNRNVLDKDCRMVGSTTNLQCRVTFVHMCSIDIQFKPDLISWIISQEVRRSVRTLIIFLSKWSKWWCVYLNLFVIK